MSGILVLQMQPKTQDAQLEFRLPQWLMDRVREYAGKHGVTPSEVARRALVEFLRTAPPPTAIPRAARDAIKDRALARAARRRTPAISYK